MIYPMRSGRMPGEIGGHLRDAAARATGQQLTPLDQYGRPATPNAPGRGMPTLSTPDKNPGTLSTPDRAPMTPMPQLPTPRPGGLTDPQARLGVGPLAGSNSGQPSQPQQAGGPDTGSVPAGAMGSSAPPAGAGAVAAPSPNAQVAGNQMPNAAMQTNVPAKAGIINSALK